MPTAPRIAAAATDAPATIPVLAPVDRPASLLTGLSVGVGVALVMLAALVVLAALVDELVGLAVVEVLEVVVEALVPLFGSFAAKKSLLETSRGVLEFLQFVVKVSKTLPMLFLSALLTQNATWLIKSFLLPQKQALIVGTSLPSPHLLSSAASYMQSCAFSGYAEKLTFAVARPSADARVARKRRAPKMAGGARKARDRRRRIVLGAVGCIENQGWQRPVVDGGRVSCSRGYKIVRIAVEFNSSIARRR